MCIYNTQKRKESIRSCYKVFQHSYNILYMRLGLLRGCRLHSASAKADATLGFTSCIRALHLRGCSLPEGGRARSAESLPLFLQSLTILTPKNV